MTEMANGHERWSEELAAYLLGALEPEEMVGFERHAENCERCQAEARWLMPAMQALPESVERIEAPPRLRERIMAEVRADAAAAPRGAGAGAAAAEAGNAGAAPGAAEGAGATATAGGGRSAGGVRTGELGAAARGGRGRQGDGTGRDRGGRREGLAGVGLGGGARGLRPAVGLAALLLALAAVAGYLVGNDDGSAPPAGGPPSTVVSGHAPGVVATMVREGEGGSLHLKNVKPIPAGRVLEAWVQRDGKVTPVRALFAPDREGRAATTVADMRGVETVMVTVEPAGGSAAPTSAPIATMPIPG